VIRERLFVATRDGLAIVYREREKKMREVVVLLDEERAREIAAAVCRELGAGADRPSFVDDCVDAILDLAEEFGEEDVADDEDNFEDDDEPFYDDDEDEWGV
jgi:hypothetical protein